MRVYDISLPLQVSLACWPGDTPLDFRLVSSLAGGDTVNVGSLTLSAHAGTHVDAPFHFLEGGATVEEIPIDVFVGPAVVVDVSGRASIGCDDLPRARLSQASRLLLRTGGWTDHARFPEVIPVLEPEVAGWLQASGVRLLGVDVPSVDAIDSVTLPVHHALTAAGITILESLDLRAVPEGVYELIAAPLRLVGGDAAPVRALLRAQA